MAARTRPDESVRCARGVGEGSDRLRQFLHQQRIEIVVHRFGGTALFGRALLLHHWCRIGTKGRRRLDPHPDPGAACNALAQLARQKRRRGYLPRAIGVLIAA